MADPEQTPRLRPAHVLASSLAAVTGAFLASRLGVYGTVIGVGVISLFSTIGTDLYVRSLDRTRQMAAWSKARTVALSRSGPAVETVELPRTAGSGELPEVAATGPQPRGGDPAGPSTNDAATDSAGDAGHQPTAVVADAANDERSGGWTKARLLLVAAGALASFVLAFVVITGIESVSGSSLSGGGRTTLGELIADGGDSSGPEDTDVDDVDAPEQPVPTPEPTPPGGTEPPGGSEQGLTVPPAEEAPEVEQPAEPQTPSPSPTESPTSEPTEPPDGGEDSAAGSTDSQSTD